MTDEDSFLANLMEQDDITWQSMLFELVKTEQMDPWDVDIGKLAEKFIDMIKEMHETNLKVGGKVILASTILLRLKSGKFIDTDLAQLEQLIAGMNEEYMDDDFEEYDMLDEDGANRRKGKGSYKIYPRTPQPRQRNVSVYDLISALEEVIEKNKIRIKPKKRSTDPVELKINSRDINLIIRDVFDTLNQKCRTKDDRKLKFSDLTPSNRREDLISTFIPLLHLTNQRVTDLFQDEAFSDFDVHLLKEGLSFEDLEKISEEEPS